MTPRRTRPPARIWLYTVWTMLLGTLKLSPSLPPDWDMIRVLMPITSPSVFTSGPPLLPGFTATSDWM